MAKSKVEASQVELVAPAQDSSKVAVGCRLPHGLVLRVDSDPKNVIEVEIEGVNKSRIIGSDFVVNMVDKQFWEEWKKANAGTFAPFLSQAIFEAGSYSDAVAKAKELEKVKTGFEGLDPTKETQVKPLEA